MVTDKQIQVILSMKDSLQEKETALNVSSQGSRWVRQYYIPISTNKPKSVYRKSIFKDKNTELPKTVNKLNLLISALLLIIILLSVGFFS